MVHQRAITSLAIVKISWDHARKDYVESFVPFIATLINKYKYDIIKTTQVCEDFKREFGLAIPYHAMRTILTRAKARKVIRKRAENYVPVLENIVRYDFADLSRKQERKQEKVISEFIRYCKEKYSVDLDRDDAESTFISCLKKQDLEILFASQEKSVLPKVKQSKRDQFLFSSFVKNSYESEPEIFGFLVETAIGHILASAMLYGSELGQFQGKLRNLSLYLDTRFVFRLLGVEGKEREFIHANFLTNLRNQGAGFFVFEHTYDEIMRILQACFYWVESLAYDPTKASIVLRYFVDSGYRQTDVQRFIDNVDSFLSKHKIAVTPTPDPYEYRAYQIDEGKIGESIVDAYKALNPRFAELEKEFTIQKDIQSVSAIYRLRKGATPTSIKKAGHVFVTSNQGLAYSSRRFEISQQGDAFHIPACLTDTFVGTLVWLQSPAQVGPLSEKKIIADCYAAMQPDRTLLKRFVNEVDKLKSEGLVHSDEYYLLRSSIVARELLAEKTMGDPENFTEKTTLEILDEMKARIKEEEKQKFLAEKESHEKTKEELERTRSQKERSASRLEERADQVSGIVSNIVFSLLIALFVAAVTVTYFPELSRNTWLRLLSCLAALVFGIASVLFGLNVKGFKVKVRTFVKYKLTRWLGGVRFGEVSRRDAEDPNSRQGDPNHT